MNKKFMIIFTSIISLIAIASISITIAVTKGEKGVQGDAGVGIASITKTKTEGLVDTYTITYTDGKTTTFKITNGSQGNQGDAGNDGHSPIIEIGENANWFIDGTDTNKRAIGSQGNQGDAGNDGHSPIIEIGENGNWFIDGIDTNKKAIGSQGDSGSDGVGIKSVEIVSGDLIVNYTDGTNDNLGSIFEQVSPKSVVQKEGYKLTLQSNNTYSVSEIDSTATYIEVVDSENGIFVESFDHEVALNNTNIQTITVGKHLTSINQGAFSGCTNLTSFNVPSDSLLTTIGDNCFKNCENLEVMPTSNYLTTIGSYAFTGTKLASVNLPDSVVAIKNHAFYNLTTLSSITIGDDSRLTTIETYAFSGCTSLTSIVIPFRVSLIERYAFYNSGLTSATFKSPDSWNLIIRPGDYPYHLSPTKTSGPAKALKGEITIRSTTYSLYKQDWVRADEYANNTIAGTYEKEF